MSEIEAKCIFCQIISGKKPETELIYQDDDFVGFRDIHPAAPHHCLIVPRKRIKNPSVLGVEGVKLGFLGALLVTLTVLSVVLADDGCPNPSAIAPCTCDGEGVSCNRATNIHQIKKAFRANYSKGGGMYVYIQGTPITEIPGDCFNNYKAENFYIELNKITKVDMKCFDHTAKYIKAINFFGNQLTSFDYSYMQKYPLLQNLNLGRNKIKTIPANAINHDNLVNLTLAANKIHSIGPNAFLNCPNLRKLDLSNNKLKSLADFSIALMRNSPGLQINLTGNELSTISRTAFHNASPRVLFIGQNKLTALKEEVFSSLLGSMARHGGEIEMRGNPFSCKGCADYAWIVDNKYVLNQMCIGFICPDNRTGILGLTRAYIGC